MCKINLNEVKNGIELVFDSKPDQATIDAIKAQGFRWSRGGGLWWAKQTPERLTFAATLGELTQTAPKADSNTELYDLSNLGANRPNCYGGAELSKAIREELKKRGVKGCTVKVNHFDSITITWKASAEHFASIEEAKKRASIWDLFRYRNLYLDGHMVSENEYNEMDEAKKEEVYTAGIIAGINNFSNVYAGAMSETRNERKFYYELSAKGYKTLSAILAIANQWNYDNSDSMTDYFDVGYYLDVDIKKPEGFEPRAEMTEDERNAYADEIATEQAAEEARWLEWEREQEERRKAHEEAEKRRKADEELIYNTCIIEDLDESEQLYITNMISGIGKECSLDELNRTLEEYAGHINDCLITRKVIFPTIEGFEAFARNLLDDFVFLYGKGGTASQDVRLDDTNYYKLTADQRDNIKFYSCNCVAIYCGEELKLVSDPQGYNYSRYTYKPTEDSETLNAAEVTAEQAKESETLTPFYFPEDVEKQCDNLHEGQEITIYQCDGWNLTSVYAGAGIVTGFYKGDYAQYTGMYIELLDGRKEKTVFIHNGRKCLIYEGIKEKLPATLTHEAVTDNMFMLYNADVLLANILNYYGEQGQQPLVDTIQR